MTFKYPYPVNNSRLILGVTGTCHFGSGQPPAASTTASSVKRAVVFQEN